MFNAYHQNLGASTWDTREIGAEHPARVRNVPIAAEQYFPSSNCSGGKRGLIQIAAHGNRDVQHIQVGDAE